MFGFTVKMGFHAGGGRILLERWLKRQRSHGGKPPTAADKQAPDPQTSRFLTDPVRVQRQNLHLASGEVRSWPLILVPTGYSVSQDSILHQEKL